MSARGRFAAARRALACKREAVDPPRACLGVARGYTLVELLVVAAIVTILVATTALAWRHDPARVLESQAQRLAAQLELALARSQLAGDRLALSVAQESYVFWRRDEGGMWRAIDNDSGLDAAQLAPSVRIVRFDAAGMAVGFGQRMRLAADQALAITLDGPGARAIVASGAFSGRIDVRVERVAR